MILAFGSGAAAFAWRCSSNELQRATSRIDNGAPLTKRRKRIASVRRSNPGGSCPAPGALQIRKLKASSR